jgi:uncharacterized protein YdaU (DUF1376 family)
MHYYKRNLGDYAKKAGRLSMLQHGSYTLLIDSCYDREQFPTLDEAIEWTWASTTDEIEAVKFVLSKFFVLENGLYVQKRIQEELAEYREKAETNKRIALERETKRKENATNRSQVVNEAPPNHKPITKNHKPISIIGDATASPTPSANPKKGARLPADWQPSDELLSWAKQKRPDLNLADTAESFRDFWHSKAGKDACKLDWGLTFKNWVRSQKAGQFVKPEVRPAHTKPTPETPEQVASRKRYENEAFKRTLADFGVNA